MRLSLALPWCLCASASSAIAGDPNAGISPASSSGGGWEFSISAGPAYKNIGRLKIDSGYRSGGVSLPDLVGPSFLVVPAGPGSLSGVADRQYNDGYVNQDGGTSFDGLTGNWGYNSGSQVQGDQLAFHSTGSEGRSSQSITSPALGPASKSTLDTIAPHLQFDAKSPYRVGPFRLGVSAGLDYGKTHQSLAFSNFSAAQTLSTYTDNYEDRYDLNGVIPPEAPYAGPLAGGGAVIGNIPNSRTVDPVLAGTNTALFSNKVFSSLNVNAFSFTVGPTLSMEQGKFDFAISSGLIVNVYDWSARQYESLDATTNAGTVEVAKWAEGDSGLKIRPGLYIQGEAGYSFTERIGLTSFLRLDAASEFRAQAGPTIYRVDPYGVTAGLQVRFTLP